MDLDEVVVWRRRGSWEVCDFEVEGTLWVVSEIFYLDVMSMVFLKNGPTGTRNTKQLKEKQLKAETHKHDYKTLEIIKPQTQTLYIPSHTG